MNLVVGLLMLGGSALMVWGGITDPEGGLLNGVRNAMTGDPNTKHTSSTAAALMQSVAALAGAGGPSLDGSTTAPAVALTAGAGTRAAVIATARTWLGVPYRFGGNTRTGVDCSGYTRAVYQAAAGITLPRVAAAQQLTGRAVSMAAAQPGDLVFFGAPAHHVGIYLGGGSIIHAPHTGTVVRVEKIWGGEPVTVRDVLDQARRSTRPRPGVVQA